MCRCQRRVTAKVDFDDRRKPAQFKAVLERAHERRLGEIQLSRHRLHPLRIALVLEQADRSRVAGKRLVSERVDLEARYRSHDGNQSFGTVPVLVAKCAAASSLAVLTGLLINVQLSSGRASFTTLDVSPLTMNAGMFAS